MEHGIHETYNQQNCSPSERRDIKTTNESKVEASTQSPLRPVSIPLSSTSILVLLTYNNVRAN